MSGPVHVVHQQPAGRDGATTHPQCSWYCLVNSTFSTTYLYTAVARCTARRFSLNLLVMSNGTSGPLESLSGSAIPWSDEKAEVMSSTGASFFFFSVSLAAARGAEVEVVLGAVGV